MVEVDETPVILRAVFHTLFSLEVSVRVTL
jgi:hypothetical protein